MLEQLRDYLKNGLGGLGECIRVQLPRSFPLVISSGYVFYRTEVVGRSCVVALAGEGMVHTPRMVQKQLNRVAEEFHLPAVFVTMTLHPHDKERYLAVGQALVVPGKFAYLPFAGTMQDDSRRSLVITRETLSPIAQLIVLAFLEHKLEGSVTIKDAMALLKASPPAIQNAFKEIEYFGLASRKRPAGAVSMELDFAVTGRELWDKAQRFLVSPVKRTVGMLTTPLAQADCVVAGVDALSEMGRLNVHAPTEFAMPLRGFSKRGVEVVSTLGAPIKLQLWAYSPVRLGGVAVDLFSLILSLRGVTDDRVQIEIDRILEEFKW